jgi:hypothetical protein
MKSTRLWAAIGTLILALGPTALAQNLDLSGVINDFTPAHDMTGAAVGPWVMHGEWHVHVNGNGTATFSAAFTMEDSDYWLVINPNPPADPDNPATRSPHTHDVQMQGKVSYDTSVCPANSPATTTGFVLNGIANVAANGSPAPFQVTGGPSPLQVCVTGGTALQYSNVTLVFSTPASNHFGSQAIHGAVRLRK